MIYDAKIVKIVYMEDYEGSIHIILNNTTLFVCYQAPFDFAKEHLQINKIISVDLWLFDATVHKSSLPIKCIPNNLKVAGGIIQGQITKLISPNESRINCGPFEIDISNNIPLFTVGDYIRANGTYTIFFPGTGYSKEAVWG